MTDWFTGITCYLSRQINRPSSRLQALSCRSTGLSAVHFDPNYMSGSCSFPHSLVFSISNLVGEGRIDGRTGKGCHVVRLGHIDQRAQRTRATARVLDCRTLSDVGGQWRLTRTEDHQRRRSRRSVWGIRHQLTVNYRNMTSAGTPTTYSGLIEIGQVRMTSSREKRVAPYPQSPLSSQFIFH